MKPVSPEREAELREWYGPGKHRHDDVEFFIALLDAARAAAGERPAGKVGRMVRIADLIAELQQTLENFGNTCVYIRDMSWGAVALNRHDEDLRGDPPSAPPLPVAGRREEESNG